MLDAWVVRDLSAPACVGVAVACCAAALCVRSLLGLWVEGSPWITFLPGVLLCGAVGGLHAAALALALSALVGQWLVVGEPGQLAVGNASELVSLVAFAVVGTILGGAGTALRRAARRAQHSAAQARHSDETARRVEVRLSRLYESGVAAIAVGCGAGAIRDANDTFLQLVGASRERLSGGGLAWPDLLDADGVALLEAALQRSREHGGAQRWEALLRGSGGDAPVLLQVARLNAEEQLFIAVDLRESKRHCEEQALSQARALQESSARQQAEQQLQLAVEQLRQARKLEAIGLLAGGIAHDFNNLVTVMLGYSALVIEQLRAGDPVRADLEQVLLAGQRAAALTQQLLAFSRNRPLCPRSVDLNALLAALLPMLQRLLGEDVELLFRPGSGLERVIADPGQLEQVVMNLALNARDAMPQGGTLAIETSNAVLDAGESVCEDGGARVLLSVRDTGIGMDADTRARIFEPFFTTKEGHGGAGLGLSTVCAIVRQSGGAIRVCSEPGLGTAFHVYLPRAVAPQPLAPAAAPSVTVRGSVAPRGSETILLVEDETQVRMLARSLLDRSGYRVLAAADAADALRICEDTREPIHLLLTDVVLPRMHGCQLAERVARLRPGIRVLFMSGYTDDAIRRRGLHAPEAAFIEKPLMPDALLARLRAALDAPA